ncbi:MAG TPA: aspartate--tRNA(Asn) ligase [Steroidobacteraceae bacterium]|nr:aspartate--tRNA(Asn) ligase [Steroidobacteraceae bacterium]
MPLTRSTRIFAASVVDHIDEVVLVRGWVHRLRTLASTVFVVVRDCTGVVQGVCGAASFPGPHIKLDDTVELRGRVRRDARAKSGCEIDIEEIRVLNPAGHKLPFNSGGKIGSVGQETLLEYRPLAARNDAAGNIFRIQGLILDYFRAYLRKHHFTEIITSKIVASGTEGGTNLFQIDYFDRVAYLAQSPQFYKEHGVAAFERVFETGHVYRAEPHASSRHLTEYYSLDLEMGFIDGPEEVIELERDLLCWIFGQLNRCHWDLLGQYRRAPLPSLLDAPVWEFRECLELLAREHGTRHLHDDLDPEAERRLCALAATRVGVPAVFVIGFPSAGRPFYSAPRDAGGTVQSFDLLYDGLEITTGGQRMHSREMLEASLRSRGLEPAGFEHHLRMFELGMPPHGGLAIGLERLTAQILGLQNVREAVLYPRDRYRLSP